MCFCVLAVALGWAAAPAIPSASLRASAQTDGWTEPVAISTTTEFSWFPDLAVDSAGRVHVVWDSSPTLEQKSSTSLLRDAVLLLHAVGQDGIWSAPNDIWFHPVRTDIYRASVAADRRGALYLVSHIFGFTTAPADGAGSARNWAESQPFLESGNIYGSEITVDTRGGIHVVWDKLIEVEAPDPLDPRQTIRKMKADIFYRHSLDFGRTWSPIVDLSDTPEGENRPQIKADARGVIYASWDTGWDRLTEESARERKTVLRISKDGGQTWQEPIIFDYPVKQVIIDREPVTKTENAQMAIAPDGKGGIMAVWRSLLDDYIFYSWSSDDGTTWTEPNEIPGIVTRDWNETRFDGYHMETDSAGRIHLVAVGRPALGTRPGLYHLTWNGESWSSPDPIYTGEGWPEWPRVAVSQGNRLHAVWFVRNQLETEGGKYQIWYSSATAEAPAEPLPPTPTPTPTLAPPTPTPRITATPRPVLPERGVRAQPERLRDEKDDLLQIAVAWLPIALLLGVFVLVAKSFRGR